MCSCILAAQFILSPQRLDLRALPSSNSIRSMMMTQTMQMHRSKANDERKAARAA